jgi:hypothetical protein
LRNKTYARYPSLSDVERCSREALERHDERGGGRSSVTGSHSFTGTKDMQTFLDMLSNGWPEGIAEAKGLDGLASDHHERLQFERNVSGAFVNVPAHLQGDPMSMLNPVIAPSDNTRSLTLVVDNCYNCNIESNAVLRYAQEIMRVVAWLSAERIECSVVSVRAKSTTAIFTTG